MVAERLIKSYEDKIKFHCIRPATVCGFSPRMRLDVSVNMFVFQALKKTHNSIWRKSNSTKYSYKRFIKCL